MDALREIFDAMNSRIRSPIFGSIAVMFILFNWKPLFYLAFADATVVEKFEYFDKTVTYWTAFILPACAGFSFAMATPWIALFSAWIAEAPTTRRKIRQITSADKILTKRIHLEQTRKQFLANEEQALIEAAKRDEKVQDIRDEQIRKNLQDQIDDIRRATQLADGQVVNMRNTIELDELLSSLASNNNIDGVGPEERSLLLRLANILKNAKAQGHSRKLD